MATIPRSKTNDTLLNSKQAEVAKAVRASGLPVDAFDFQSRETDDSTFTSLVYLGEGPYHFDFHPSPRWRVVYAPAEETASKWEEPGTWAMVLRCVENWLRYVARELAVSDPWAELLDTGQASPLTVGEVDNSPLGPDERELVIERIEALRRYLIDSGERTEHDLHIITDRLNYLSDAVTRLGRFDWRNVATAIVIDLGMHGLLDAGVARNVLDFLVGAARQLLAP